MGILKVQYAFRIKLCLSHLLCLKINLLFNKEKLLTIVFLNNLFAILPCTYTNIPDF